MATIFTTTPSSLIGDVYATTFTHNLNNSYKTTVWNFGDGTHAYDQNSASHSYNYPGTYQVSVTAENYDGTKQIDQTSVTANLAYRDAIVFTKIPSFGIAGRETTTPFTISLTSSRVDESISVCLYSYNSNSAPHFAVPDRWGFIIPKWRFIDAETKAPFTDSVLISTVPLYKDSVVVGVSGQLSFYYLDDSSTGLGTESEKPLLLVATLSTENFSYPPESQYHKYKGSANPKTTSCSITWHVNDAQVTNYKITENYLNEIYPIKWKDVPIPVMVTCLFQPPYSTEAPSDVLGYPRTNELGLQNPINLTLYENGFAVSPNLYDVEAPQYFRARDADNNPCSGYIFTTMTPLTSFAGTMQIGVSSTLTNQETIEGAFSFPYGYPLYAQTFVNNIYHSNINVIFLYNFNFSPLESPNFDAYPVPVPTLYSVNVMYNEISGTSGTYGLSFNPVLNRLYGIDADQDSLMYFNYPYTLTSRTTLSALTQKFPSVPSYLSIDGNHNVWVSMYNSYQLVKLDQNMNYLLSAAPLIAIPYDEEVEGSLIVASNQVETDQDNNVWATFAHPTSSMLFKFDSDGNQLIHATELSLSSVPVSMAVDPFKNVWVCCYQTSTIDLHDATDGHILSSISGGFLHPSYMMLDREANVWFTHGYDFVSKYDIRTYQLSTWKFEDGLETRTVHNEPYDTYETYQALHDPEIWAGLGVDVYNRVWVVDYKNNKVGVFKSSNPLNAFITEVTPAVSPLSAQSAQVTGDWTGNRWYQKYANVNQVSLENVSAPFNVYGIDDFEIAKVNETFDYSKHMKSLALPEILSTKDKLFDEFLKASAGDDVLYNESPGRVSYERIANFLQNHADIETTEIDQLDSQAKQLSVQTKTFGEGFPAAVNRLLNLFSVPKQRLRGTIQYSEDFEDNIKELLEDTSIVNANEVLVAKDRQYGTYQFVVVAPIAAGALTINSYPLSQMEVAQMRDPLLDNYYFFRYQESAIGHTGNIIDWDSKYTTISYSLSTAEQWYGDEGLVDIMFNKLLTKQLFLE